MLNLYSFFNFSYDNWPKLCRFARALTWIKKNSGYAIYVVTKIVQ